MDSIVSRLTQSSLLYATLFGVRTALEKNLGIHNLELSTSNDHSRSLASKITADSTTYSWLSLQELAVIRRTNGKLTKRHGLPLGSADATKATSVKAWLWPVTIGLNLHYVNTNPIETIHMAEAMVVLASIGGASFELKFGEVLDLHIDIKAPENVTVPIKDVDDTTIAASEVELYLTVDTYAGFLQHVAAVNGNPPNFSYIFKDTL